MLDTLLAKLNIQGKVVQTVLGLEGGRALLISIEIDIRRLDQSSLAGNGGLEKSKSETGSGIGHRQGSRSSAILGLDDLIPSVLDAVGQSIQLLLGEALNKAGDLGENRDDGDTRVSTNNSDASGLGVDRRVDLRDESGRADDIQGADTKDPISFLESSQQVVVSHTKPFGVCGQRGLTGTSSLVLSKGAKVGVGEKVGFVCY